MPATVQKEKVTDTAALRSVSNVMDMATGAGRVFNITLSEDDIFRGNATIPGGAIGGGVLYLAFKFDPNEGTIGYVQARLSTDSIDTLDIDRQDAPTVRQRRLRCNTGNVQCGGKCQNAAQNCFAYMSPAQKKEAMRALRLARRSGGPIPSYNLRGGLQMGPSPAPAAAPVRQQTRRSAPPGVNVTRPTPGTTQYDYKVGQTEYRIAFVQTSDKRSIVIFSRGAGQSSIDRNADPRESAQAAVKVSRILKAHAQGLPEGHQLALAADNRDGKGSYRGYAVEKMGFTRPMMGKVGREQLAKVQGGKLVPDREAMEARENIMDPDASRKYDRAWERNTRSLQTRRSEARSERATRALAAPAMASAAEAERRRSRSELPNGVTLEGGSYGREKYTFEVPGASSPTFINVTFAKSASGVTDVSFQRNGSYNMAYGHTSTEQDAIAAVKIARIMKHKAATSPEGSKFICQAASSDGHGVYRSIAYQRAGFSRPSMGYAGGTQFAKVEGGKLVPDVAAIKAADGQSFDRKNSEWEDTIAASNTVRSTNRQHARRSRERSRSDKGDREPITDRIVLRHLLNSIGSATGATQLINVTKEGDIFRGNAIIPGGAVGGGPLYLAFKMKPTIGGMAYREATIAQDSAAAIRVDAPTAGRRLKCKAGNVQCGGKCQDAKKNCFEGMTPDQKRSAMKALKAAGRSGSAPATPEPKIETPKSKTKKAQPPTPKGEGPQMPKGVKVKETQKRTDYTFKVGADRYDITFFHRDDGGSTVAFTTNGRMWGTDGQSTRDAAIAAVKINRVVKAHVAKLPDGHKLDASAFRGDDKETYRAYAYARFGFTRPEFGEPGMEQFGKVSRGKIVPDRKRLRDSEHEEDRKEYDRDWKKALKDLEKDRSRSRESARAA